MSWTKLLASKEAQRHKTSKKELDNTRALIAPRPSRTRPLPAFRQTGGSRLPTTLHSRRQIWLLPVPVIGS